MAFTRLCGLPPRNGITCEQGARADIVILDEVRRFHYFLDVTIIHPNPGNGKTDPAADLRRAHLGKLVKYKSNHDVNEAQVIPLAFESTGGRLPETDVFLNGLVRSAAKGDDKLMNRLWNRINYQLAAAVAKGEGNILTALRRLNRLPGHVARSQAQQQSGVESGVLPEGAGSIETSQVGRGVASSSSVVQQVGALDHAMDEAMMDTAVGVPRVLLLLLSSLLARF